MFLHECSITTITRFTLVLSRALQVCPIRMAQAQTFHQNHIRAKTDQAASFLLLGCSNARLYACNARTRQSVQREYRIYLLPISFFLDNKKPTCCVLQGWKTANLTYSITPDARTSREIAAT